MSIYDGHLPISWPLTEDSAVLQALRGLADRKGGWLLDSAGGRVVEFWSGTPPVLVLGGADYEAMLEFLGSAPDAR